MRAALVREMDIPTLLSWKATCSRNYVDVADELRDSLRRLLAAFVPSPSALLSLATRTHSLISGEFAIQYLLRDNAFVANCLDIYVGSVLFHTFIDEFTDDHTLSGYQTSSVLSIHGEPYAYKRQVRQSLQVRLSTGKTIYVHASSTASPCHALACSPSSVGTTFITEFCFATAYPRLTFNRRGLICLSQLAGSMQTELDMYERLEACGFAFNEDPTSWTDYSPFSGNTRPDACLRSVYLCPQQGRYFGDRGSLVALVDQFEIGFRQLKSRGLPPYGIMAAWRLPSDVLCDEQCDVLDEVIGPDLLVTSVVLENDPFASQSSSAYYSSTSHVSQSKIANRKTGRRCSM